MIIFIIAVLALATTLFTVSGADVVFLQNFYSPSGGWIFADNEPWHFLYLYGPIPCYLLGGFALVVLLLGFFRPLLRKYRKKALFLVLALALGPGLLVNTVFKDNWGRPRPREIADFGGTRQYLPVWKMGNVPGKSFPSGHAAGAFYLLTPFFICRKRKRAACAFLVMGCGFGLVVGVARVVQGGHFITDILWSAGVVLITGILLSRWLRIEADDEALYNVH
jgi:membrane-associated PAP2 superfamily phosphatase